MKLHCMLKTFGINMEKERDSKLQKTKYIDKTKETLYFTC